MFSSLFKISLGVFLLAGTPVMAQESGDDGDGEPKSDKVEKFHDQWSKHVLKGANRIDSYFGNERSEEDSQQTRVKVRVDYESIEDGDGGLGGHISAKIVLPSLENRWALVINGDDEDEGGDLDGADESNSLSLRFDLFSDNLKNVSFDVGVRRPGDDYELFGRARHRVTTPHEKWVSRLDNKLYIHQDYGVEYDGKLDFDRGLPPLSLFRYRTRVRWWE